MQVCVIKIKMVFNTLLQCNDSNKKCKLSACDIILRFSIWDRETITNEPGTGSYRTTDKINKTLDK